MPLATIEHLVGDRHTNGLLESQLHVLIGFDGSMQRPVQTRILQDQKGRLVVGDVKMPAMARTVQQWNTVIKFVAAIQALAEFEEMTFPFKFDTQLFPHEAAATVAAHQVRAAN